MRWKYTKKWDRKEKKCESTYRRKRGGAELRQRQKEWKQGRKTDLEPSAKVLLFCFFSQNLRFPSVLSALRCAKQKSHETANKGKLTEGKWRNRGSEEGVELRTKMPWLCTFREKEKDNDEKRGKKRQNSKKKKEIGKRAQEGACVPTRKTFEKNWRESTEIERWQRVRLLGKYVAKEMEAKDSENTREERLWLRQSKLRGKAENMSVERGNAVFCMCRIPASNLSHFSALCPFSSFSRWFGWLPVAWWNGNETKMMKTEKWTKPERATKRKRTRTGGNWGRFRIRFGERLLTGKLSWLIPEV